MTPENRVGEVLASKYRLEELLGSGGMGHVYRAVNQDVGRSVAIKLLRSEYAGDAQLVERFLREARAANLVRHPNVVDVIDIGREAGGAPFIVQELLEGEDLAQLVARRGGRLAIGEVVDVLAPVIDAVAEAHARGVIHRDLKPENVFLATGKRGPTPKLLDFGISKVRASDLQATEVGVMMGTPAYMPPEQLQGARDADARSDVWALGVMLFEVIAGRMPFEDAEPHQLFLAIATTDAPTLLEVGVPVSPAVSQIVARCLRRKPEDRYPSAAELARDLRHLIEGDAIEPTSKRSLPPSAATRIPDLAIPAPPGAPTMMAPVEAPSLAPPAVPPPPPPPAIARTDLGQMHAVTSSRAMPPARSFSRPRPERASKSGADTSTLIGIAVVGLVVVLGVGLLMQVLHRPEGWAVARFVLAPGKGLETALHAFLALLGLGLGATYAWRGVRHWRGDLGGGPPNAVVSAVVAAGAFFCVIEIVCAVT